MAFNRFLFNNKTLNTIDGFTNIKHIKPVFMNACSSYVKIWSRSSTIGCHLYVCDSITTDTNTYTGSNYTTPNILKADLWIYSSGNVNFKLSNAYGYRLHNYTESFKEFDDLVNKMISVMRTKI